MSKARGPGQKSVATTATTCKERSTGLCATANHTPFIALSLHECRHLVTTPSLPEATILTSDCCKRNSLTALQGLFRRPSWPWAQAGDSDRAMVGIRPCKHALAPRYSLAMAEEKDFRGTPRSLGLLSPGSNSKKSACWPIPPPRLSHYSEHKQHPNPIERLPALFKVTPAVALRHACRKGSTCFGTHVRRDWKSEAKLHAPHVLA